MEVPDIVVDWDVGPVLSQDRLGVGVVLNELGCPVSTPRSGNCELSCSTEEAEMSWSFIQIPP